MLGRLMILSGVLVLGILGSRAMTQKTDTPRQAEVELGRALFYDPFLSDSGKIACASCHHQDKAFTDGRAVSFGVHGRQGTRSAPSLVNVGVRRKLFWHGGSPTLELQAIGPLTDHVEHGLKVDEIVRRLRTSPKYAHQFRKVFGQEASMTTLTKALASFERTIVSYNSPFDRFQAGDASAFTAQEERGMDLFYGKAECFHCHTGRDFSDQNAHNNGSELFNEDLGLAVKTEKDEDIGKFITPTLRNIGLTAPYMHAGQMSTLREVVIHYNNGGQPNPNIDPLIHPLGLNDQEVDDLVAFLGTLTDPTIATNPKFSNPNKP